LPMNKLVTKKRDDGVDRCACSRKNVIVQVYKTGLCHGQDEVKTFVTTPICISPADIGIISLIALRIH
jgi:hypothetical protein